MLADFKLKLQGDKNTSPATAITSYTLFNC